MAKGFTLRLAYANLVRSRRMVFPYMLAAALMSGMYFIISNVIDARSISNIPSGPTTQSVLMIGRVLMTIFIVLYMFYLNSFLIKPRKKEFGLYGVLGLEKRHVARIVCVEGLLLNMASLLLGLLTGCAFGELIFQALLRVMHVAPGSQFSLSPAAFQVTLAVFAFVFVFTSLYNVFTVYRSSTISLLSGEGKAEKQARGVPFIAVAGFILLICAYAFAVSVTNSGTAIAFFWPAVLLVILATYLLFTAGSAFILSVLSKRKTLYYKPQAFITIGFLKHRMKQNAAGLANICILSTMVLVTITACSGLYVGQEDILHNNHPQDVHVFAQCYGDDTRSSIPTRAVEDAIAACAREYGLTDVPVYTFESIPLPEMAVENGVLLQTVTDTQTQTIVQPQILSPESYAALTGSLPDLSEEECILLYPEPLGLKSGLLGGLSVLRVEPYPKGLETPLFSDHPLYIVLSSREGGRTLAQALNQRTDRIAYRSHLFASFGLSQETGVALTDHLREVFRDACTQMREGQDTKTTVFFNDIYSAREEGYGLFGGLIFLGAFCAILFAINTVLIIYFKQLSEGYEDRERYHILQKVGMDQSQVRHTINFQILFIFFLPLAAALLHTCFAFPLLTRILSGFKMENISLIFQCALITAAVFSLCYAIVFKLTARTYYHLVKR